MCLLARSLAHSVGWSSTSGFTVIFCQRYAITGAIEHHEEAGDIGVRLCCRVSLSTVRTSLSLMSINMTRQSSPDERKTILYGCTTVCPVLFLCFVVLFGSAVFYSFVCFVRDLCIYLAPVHAGRYSYPVFLCVGDSLYLYVWICVQYI